MFQGVAGFAAGETFPHCRTTGIQQLCSADGPKKSRLLPSNSSTLPSLSRHARLREIVRPTGAIRWIPSLLVHQRSPSAMDGSAHRVKTPKLYACGCVTNLIFVRQFWITWPRNARGKNATSNNSICRVATFTTPTLHRSQPRS